MIPESGNAFYSYSWRCWLTGKAKARQAGNDQMESIRCITAVLRRVREWADDVEKLQHRSGPAMGDEQGLGLRMRAPDMKEMDLEPVNFSNEVVVLIQ